MPTAERLAKSGWKYSAFHTTALCSPTRAALITGRNHHSYSTGVITELATGYHLTTDLADDCIGWMRQQKAIDPNKPLFAYFLGAPGHGRLGRRVSQVSHAAMPIVIAKQISRPMNSADFAWNGTPSFKSSYQGSHFSTCGTRRPG